MVKLDASIDWDTRAPSERDSVLAHNGRMNFWSFIMKCCMVAILIYV